MEFSAILNGVRKSDVKFNFGARIEFFLDEYSLPSGLLPFSDLCLGQITAEAWSCLTNDWTETPDNYYSFPIFSAGKYALIVNPDPTLIPPNALCDWWCQYRLFVLVGGGALAVVILVSIVSIECCRGGKERVREVRKFETE